MEAALLLGSPCTVPPERIILDREVRIDKGKKLSSFLLNRAAINRMDGMLTDGQSEEYMYPENTNRHRQ